MQLFTPIFSKLVDEFLATLPPKAKNKVVSNVEKATEKTNPKLFKKLNGNIWEFRTEYLNLQMRLLAFWDKRDGKNTLVIATHGFIKKTDKVPQKEIDRAERIRTEYFNNQ